MTLYQSKTTGVCYVALLKMYLFWLTGTIETVKICTLANQTFEALIALTFINYFPMGARVWSYRIYSNRGRTLISSCPRIIAAHGALPVIEIVATLD